MFTSIVRELTDRIVDELAPPTTAELDSGQSRAVWPRRARSAPTTPTYCRRLSKSPGPATFSTPLKHNWFALPSERGSRSANTYDQRRCC